MQPLDCLADAAAARAAGRGPHRLHAVASADLPAFLETLPPEQRQALAFTGFAAKSGSIAILPPRGDGMMDGVLGLGTDTSHAPFGALPYGLPTGTLWQFVSPDLDAGRATLGFCLGAYRFTAFKAAPAPARLVRPAGPAARQAEAEAAAIWMGRDLINRPANDLGPRALAEALVALAARYDAASEIVSGGDLADRYPTIAAVGAGSDRPPHVAILRWTSPRAGADGPLVGLCGKGVCFDSGGYDLKPSAGMLRMKKDMGGAAAMMALAAMIMAADLPVRLVLRLGCVENSVSGHAMRPLDILRSRSGQTIEIGNTDAEGRLVLCDLLHESGEEMPDVLIDAATLTGAARVALGPDLPALFSNRADWAADIMQAGRTVDDPAWSLPLWPGYDSWLDSPLADMNNVSSNGLAGAIVAALFLQRFVSKEQAWVHVDLYAWNDKTRPAAPEGGEVQAMRGIFATLRRRYDGKENGQID